MDAASVKALRELLASTGWGERTRRFGKSLREAGHDPGGLLLVGTPDEEPWHLTAHLDEESRWSGMPSLAPTLVRWQPPPGRPAAPGDRARPARAGRQGRDRLRRRARHPTGRRCSSGSPTPGTTAR